MGVCRCSHSFTHSIFCLLYTSRRVVQTELPVLQQVAVVGQEGDAVVHFERAFPLELEIADGIKPVSYTHLDVYKRQNVC